MVYLYNEIRKQKMNALSLEETIQLNQYNEKKKVAKDLVAVEYLSLQIMRLF